MHFKSTICRTTSTHCVYIYGTPGTVKGTSHWIHLMREIYSFMPLNLFQFNWIVFYWSCKMRIEPDVSLGDWIGAFGPNVYMLCYSFSPFFPALLQSCCCGVVVCNFYVVLITFPALKLLRLPSATSLRSSSVLILLLLSPCVSSPPLLLSSPAPALLQGEAARFPMVSEAARWLVQDAHRRGGGCQVRAEECSLT